MNALVRPGDGQDDVMAELWKPAKVKQWTRHPYLGVKNARTSEEKRDAIREQIGKGAKKVVENGTIFACDQEEGRYFDLTDAKTLLLSSWQFYGREEESAKGKDAPKDLVEVSETKREGWREFSVVALLHVFADAYIATVSKLPGAQTRFVNGLGRMQDTLTTPLGVAKVAASHPHVASPQFPAKLRAMSKLEADVSKSYIVIDGEAEPTSGEVAKLLLGDPEKLVAVIRKALEVARERKAFFLGLKADEKPAAKPAANTFEDDGIPF